MSEPAPNSESPERKFVLELEGLEHRLHDPASGETFTVRVDKPVKVAERSFVALLGPSGCGKTTLLTILGLLRSPTSPADIGRFIIRTPSKDGAWAEHDLKSIWGRRKTSQVENLRRQSLGFALQSGELLSSLTVRENISAPLRLNGANSAECRTRVDELMTAFSLAGVENASGETRNLADQRINRLSGGEYQRVALARAMAHRPTLIFVDEPTSALNRELAFGALQQLRLLQCGADSRGAAIMITHDEELAQIFADTIIRMAPRNDSPVGEVVAVEENAPREDVLNFVRDASSKADETTAPKEEASTDNSTDASPATNSDSTVNDESATTENSATAEGQS